MVFRWDLRSLIQESDLQYLSPKRRKRILDNTTSLEVEKINQNIRDLLEWMDVEWYLDYGRIVEYWKILLIGNICESNQELDLLLFNPNLEMVFNLPIYIFRKIVSLCQNKEDFEKISQLWIISKVTDTRDSQIFWIMLSFIKSLEELEELSCNNDFIYLCLKISSWTMINIVLEFYGVKSFDDVIRMLKSWKWEHIKKILRNWTVEDIREILRIQESESFIIPEGNIVFNKIWMIWTCSQSELFNEDLLKNADYWDNSFIPIFWGDKLIAYLKMEEYWEESITGVIDVFDEKWKMLIKKWMIYAPEDDVIVQISQKQRTRKCVELEKLDYPISLNPIRLLWIRNIDALINTFKVRNGFD